MVQWIFLTCFLKSSLDTHLGAEPLWTAATSPKWLHMISHFHVTPRWFSNHSKFSDDAEWGSLRSDSSWCCHCCHQKDQSTEEEPQRPEGIHAGSAVQGRCWIRGWGNGRRILRWLQVYFLFVRNRLLHWPWCAGTHRLLGSARISGTYALCDCVHAGGEVAEGGETVHTVVFFDQSRSAIVMRFMSLLICFSSIAFWLSSATAGMQLPCFSSLHIFVLCNFLFTFVTEFALPVLADIVFPIFSKCKCKFRRARFVGNTRHKAHRRRGRPILRSKHFLPLLLFFIIGFQMLWNFHLGWHITGKLRNRNMRAMHGNGPKGSKKGKATGKGRFPKGDINSPEALEPSHEDLVQQVISVLPEAALMRQQPQLDPTEWSTRVCHWQNLDSSGGLSICPKIHIPQVLQQVGWTKEPVGILTSECPDTLGLRGFPRQEVFCTYSIMADGAQRKNVQVRKWLVQLGYGQFVIQKMFGPTVQLYSTMKEMVLKFSPHHDWPIQKIPANIVIEELSKIVSEHTISDIQPRESLSASFLCHAQSVDGLLRASGQRGTSSLRRRRELHQRWSSCGWEKIMICNLHSK